MKKVCKRRYSVENMAEVGLSHMSAEPIETNSLASFYIRNSINALKKKRHKFLAKQPTLFYTEEYIIFV